MRFYSIRQLHISNLIPSQEHTLSCLWHIFVCKPFLLANVQTPNEKYFGFFWIRRFYKKQKKQTSQSLLRSKNLIITLRGFVPPIAVHIYCELGSWI